MRAAARLTGAEERADLQRIQDRLDLLLQIELLAWIALRGAIIDAVTRLDEIPVAELAELLSAVSPVTQRARTRGRL